MICFKIKDKEIKQMLNFRFSHLQKLMSAKTSYSHRFTRINTHKNATFFRIAKINLLNTLLKLIMCEINFRKFGDFLLIFRIKVYAKMIMVPIEKDS